MVKYTMRANAKSTNWTTIGIAVREYQAVRFDVITGPAEGTYYLAAGDVAEVLGGGIAPVYELKTRAGERVPVEAGFVRSSSSGRMMIVQTDHPARFMVPALALAAHYANPTANRATRIAAPAEDLEALPARASGPVAVTA